jgi:hypothetical protein
VGYVFDRSVKGGTKYTAIYRDVRGRLRSAGTFGTKRQAARAWQRAEAELAAGRVGDPAVAGRPWRGSSSRSGSQPRHRSDHEGVLLLLDRQVHPSRARLDAHD